MKRTQLAIMAALALGAGAVATPAAAAVGTPGGIQAALDDIAVVDTVQYVHRGQRYCWSEVGWHGPGWYRCGYQWRRGFGWGGPQGWLGWSFGGDFRRGHGFREGRVYRGERRGGRGFSEGGIRREGAGSFGQRG